MFLGAGEAQAQPHWRALVGSSWNADEAATLAHVRHIKSPGIMGAITQPESGGINSAVSPTGDYCLWQINAASWDFSIDRILRDPVYCADKARAVKKEQGLTAWSAYNNGLVGPPGEVKHKLAQRIRRAIER